MGRWRSIVIALGLVGLVDSAYLTLETLTTSVALYCPEGGPVSCTTVVQSQYSEFLGVKVAYLGLLWFLVVVLVALAMERAPSVSPLLLPAWGVGVVFACYLIYIEVFLVHAVCPYCTVAHAVAFLLGVPVIKLMLGDDAGGLNETNPAMEPSRQTD